MTKYLGLLGRLQRKNEAMLHTESAADSLVAEASTCAPEELRHPTAVETPFEEPAAHVEGNACLVLLPGPTVILVRGACLTPLR